MGSHEKPCSGRPVHCRVWTRRCRPAGARAHPAPRSPRPRPAAGLPLLPLPAARAQTTQPHPARAVPWDGWKTYAVLLYRSSCGTVQIAAGKKGRIHPYIHKKDAVMRGSGYFVSPSRQRARGGGANGGKRAAPSKPVAATRRTCKPAAAATRRRRPSPARHRGPRKPSHRIRIGGGDRAPRVVT